MEGGLVERSSDDRRVAADQVSLILDEQRFDGP